MKDNGFTPLENALRLAAGSDGSIRARGVMPRASSLTGFSLIELVMALGVIVLTVFVFGIAVSSLPLTKSARNRNIAYHAAAQKIEELRNTSFVSLPSTGSFSFPIFSELESGAGQLTMSSYGGYDPNLIKQAIVTVSWYESGKQYSVRLDTLISSTGLNN